MKEKTNRERGMEKTHTERDKSERQLRDKGKEKTHRQRKNSER